MNAEENAVNAVLASYENALNESDTDAVMKLYASDGVFMPQNFPSSVGADAVRQAYEPKPIRSSSSSTRSMVHGRSHATASLPRTHHATSGSSKHRRKDASDGHDEGRCDPSTWRAGSSQN